MLLVSGAAEAQPMTKRPGKAKGSPPPAGKLRDAKETRSGQSPLPRDPEFAKYGIYEQSAPRPATVSAMNTLLPLVLNPGDHVAFVGNTLFERAQLFGHFEALLQQRFPRHQLVVRNLSWSADALGVQPRPANFADIEQHLTHERTDVIFAAFGFNESFAGDAGIEDFRGKLTAYLADLKTKAFNGEAGPRIVLVSPIANENVPGASAANLNNANIQKYAKVICAKSPANNRSGLSMCFRRRKTPCAASART
jgi:hypothetical protein